MSGPSDKIIPTKSEFKMDVKLPSNGPFIDLGLDLQLMYGIKRVPNTYYNNMMDFDGDAMPSVFKPGTSAIEMEQTRQMLCKFADSLPDYQTKSTN